MIRESLPLRTVEDELVFASSLNSLLVAVTVERQTLAYHSIDQTTETPKVTIQRIGFAKQDLRSAIANSAKWFSRLALGTYDLSKTKVYELNCRLVRAVAHHHIF